jgi:hypothetical protein
MSKTNRKKIASFIKKIEATVVDGTDMWVNSNEHPLGKPEERSTHLSKTPKHDVSHVNELYDLVEAAILEGATPGRRI